MLWPQRPRSPNMDPLVVALIVVAILVVSSVAWIINGKLRRLSVSTSQSEIDAQQRQLYDMKTQTYMDRLDIIKRDGGFPG